MTTPNAFRAQLVGLTAIALAAVPAPSIAKATTISLLCRVDTRFGDGPETTHAGLESRILIDFQRRTVTFTSPGSGDTLVPNGVSISKGYVRWTYGIPDGMLAKYSINRASQAYTVRYVFLGKDEQGGFRGSCLPKTAF